MRKVLLKVAFFACITLPFEELESSAAAFAGAGVEVKQHLGGSKVKNSTAPKSRLKSTKSTDKNKQTKSKSKESNSETLRFIAEPPPESGNSGKIRTKPSERTPNGVTSFQADPPEDSGNSNKIRTKQTENANDDEDVIYFPADPPEENIGSGLPKERSTPKISSELTKDEVVNELLKLKETRQSDMEIILNAFGEIKKGTGGITKKLADLSVLVGALQNAKKILDTCPENIKVTNEKSIKSTTFAVLMLYFLCPYLSEERISKALENVEQEKKDIIECSSDENYQQMCEKIEACRDAFQFIREKAGMKKDQSAIKIVTVSRSARDKKANTVRWISGRYNENSNEYTRDAATLFDNINGETIKNMKKYLTGDIHKEQYRIKN